MLGTLHTQMIEPEWLFMAYCVKSPRNVGFTVRYEWTDLDPAFKSIFLGQLDTVLREALDWTNYLRQPGTQALPLAGVALPAGFEPDGAPLVRDVLSLLARPNLTTAEYETACTWLALKYVASPHSQENAYIVLRFWVDKPPLGRFPLIFVTLVDLDPERKEPYVDTQSGQLALALLKNAFQKKSIVKGALYPYCTVTGNVWAPTTQLLLHEQEGVTYWPRAFECGLDLRLAKERDAFWNTIRTLSPDASPKALGRLTEVLQAGEAIGSAEIVRGFAVAGTQTSPAQVQEIIGQTVRAALPRDAQTDADLLGTSTFRTANVLRRTRIRISHGPVKIELPANELSRVEEFEYQGEYYLVVRSASRPRIDNGNIGLKARTWASYKRLIDQGEDDFAGQGA